MAYQLSSLDIEVSPWPSVRHMGMKPRIPPKSRLEMVLGVEGYAIYLNNYRIAGPKPWGGGQVVRSWKVEDADVRKALRDKRLVEDEA